MSVATVKAVHLDVDLTSEPKCEAEGMGDPSDRDWPPCGAPGEWMLVKPCGHRRILCGPHHRRVRAPLLSSTAICTTCGKFYDLAREHFYPI